MNDPTLWFPLFEFQDFTYQSYIVLPTEQEQLASAGSPITAKKWAKGELAFGQAFRVAEDEYEIIGALTFAPGVALDVKARGKLGRGDGAATFSGTGTGTTGVVAGALNEFTGWVLPELPIVAGAARVLSIHGSIRGLRGPDARPDFEAGGYPAGTVGYFVIERSAGAVARSGAGR